MTPSSAPSKIATAVRPSAAKLVRRAIAAVIKIVIAMMIAVLKPAGQRISRLRVDQRPAVVLVVVEAVSAHVAAAADLALVDSAVDSVPAGRSLCRPEATRAVRPTAMADSMSASLAWNTSWMPFCMSFMPCAASINIAAK